MQIKNTKNQEFSTPLNTTPTQVNSTKIQTVLQSWNKIPIAKNQAMFSYYKYANNFSRETVGWLMFLLAQYVFLIVVIR